MPPRVHVAEQTYTFSELCRLLHLPPYRVRALQATGEHDKNCSAVHYVLRSLSSGAYRRGVKVLSDGTGHKHPI